MDDKKTHWKKLVNPDYIGAYSLTPGEDLTVTIRSVGRQMVAQAGGKKEECTVAQLVGQKPFILNATNSKSIAKLYGPYIEDWAGKSITLYASTTKFGSEMVECLRVRSTAPNVELPKQRLNDNSLKNAMKAIIEGRLTKDALLDGYELTEDQKKQVNELQLPAKEAPAPEDAQ